MTQTAPRTRFYTGPETDTPVVPWSCPACGRENPGLLALGCAWCGAGTVQARHVGLDPPAATPPTPSMPPTLSGVTWAIEHPHATLVEAYHAGLLAGIAQREHAPPAARGAPLLPERKPRRTVIAALNLLREYVVEGHADDEIASGEWCSLAEITTLMATLETDGGFVL